MKFIIKKWKNKLYSFWLAKEKTTLWFHYKGQTYSWSPQESQKTKPEEVQKLKEQIFSPLPGKIQEVSVKQEANIKKDKTLLILSAMKMEYSFKAEADGRIKAIHIKEGDTVQKGTLLMEISYKTPSL